MIRRLPRLPVALAAVLLVAGNMARAQADPATDAPDPGPRMAYAGPALASYPQALQSWRQPEEINGWIGARFEYDNARALQLSESQRAGGNAPPIAEPASFFERPLGVCVDLARFAVETVRAVAPELRASYLMIEFEPLLRSGQVLRRHWIATYRRGDAHYFFADSRYPGRIYGPYPAVQAFVAEYAQLRQRPVVAYREVESYRRQLRAASKEKEGA